MAGRFYYRPVPRGPGVAEHLAAGLERGVNNFVSERDRLQQRDRQEEEDTRRRSREDADDAWMRAQQDMELLERGGGRGPTPTVQPNIDVPDAPRFEMPRPGMAGGASGRSPLGPWGTKPPAPSVGPTAPPDGGRHEFGGFDPLGEAKADPDFGRYAPVGDVGYVERPEFAERRQRGERTGRIASTIAGAREGNPDAAATLIDEGVASYRDLFPEDRAPVRGTPEWYEIMEREGEIENETARERAEIFTGMGFSPTGARLTGDEPSDEQFTLKKRGWADALGDPARFDDPRRAPLYDAILDELAKDRPRGDILRELQELGVPPEDIQAAETYLNPRLINEVIGAPHTRAAGYQPGGY